MLKLYNAPDFVNTSESYSVICFSGQNSIVIPYVNNNLMPENPINKQNCFIDYSYCIFKNVHLIELGSDSDEICIYIANTQVKTKSCTEYVTVGGYGHSKGGELRIQCEFYLFGFPSTSKMNINPFIPLATPNFPPNMNDKIVNDFFNNMPDEIKKIIGNDYWTIKL